MLEIKDYEVSGFKMAIRGMRNPLNSWDKSDSRVDMQDMDILEDYDRCSFDPPKFIIGESDMKLCKNLIKAGSPDRKFLRMVHVQADVVAPLYFWKEADQYKIGTTTNSCSTMHTLHKRELTIDDFSREHLTGDGLSALESTIGQINFARQAYLETKDKSYWNEMIQLLPSSYNQLRTWDLDYETLISIYFQRRNHKLTEWHTFCDWILTLPHMKEFISVLDKEKEESNV